MAEFDKNQAHAMAWIDTNRQRFSDFNLQIWHYADPPGANIKSAKAYVDLLRKEGWDVEEGSGGMPTAFAATWGSGSPVLGGYAEYDAVPGNSQQIVPHRAPREGLHPWAAGHTDPHSQLGTTALVGMLATKAAMQANGLKGTLKFWGSRRRRCADRSRCTPRRAISTAATLSFPTTRTPPTRRSPRPSRRVLERGDHVRNADPGELDRQVAAADPHVGARGRALSGRDRRAVPDGTRRRNTPRRRCTRTPAPGR